MMATIILHNCNIRTQDPLRPKASAIALQGNRILSIGSDDEILPLVGAHTRVINLGGKLVLPGFTDSHIHFYKWAIGQRELRLASVPSLKNVLELLAKKTREREFGTWIQGQGWLETFWPEPRVPTRVDLDEVSPWHPVILYRSCGHLAVANSLALKIANITNETTDPPRGLIERDANGSPTGVLKELAINLVRSQISLPEDDEAVKAMQDCFPTLHRLGLTGIHDFRSLGGSDGPPALRAWNNLKAINGLTMRAWVMIAGEQLDEAISLGLRTGMGDNSLRIGHVKYFADGSMGARTAWMIEPYLDTDTTGLPNVTKEELSDHLHRAGSAGLALTVHALGDRANHEVLDAFANTIDQKSIAGPLAAPHRVEHVQMIRPDDIRTFARLNLVASVQPIHLRDDIQVFGKSVRDRGKYGFVFKDMIQSGITLTMGSDCPVSDPNPFQGIYSAVARKGWDLNPEDGWFPEQRLTVDQAVEAYTRGPAIACGRQDELGSLSRGKLADLICLDHDIYSIPAEEILETNVVITIFDGRVIYEN